MNKIEELLNSGLINLTNMAKEIYPDNKTAPTYLNKKLRRKYGQSFNHFDKKKVENILKKYLTDIT